MFQLFSIALRDLNFPTRVLSVIDLRASTTKVEMTHDPTNNPTKEKALDLSQFEVLQ